MASLAWRGLAPAAAAAWRPLRPERAHWPSHWTCVRAHRAASAAGSFAAAWSGLTPPGVSAVHRRRRRSPPRPRPGPHRRCRRCLRPPVERPRARTSSVTRAISLPGDASAALAHTSWNRPGSMPRASMVRCSSWNRRRLVVLLDVVALAGWQRLPEPLGALGEGLSTNVDPAGPSNQPISRTLGGTWSCRAASRAR